MSPVPFVEIIIKASIVALIAITVRQVVKKQLPAVRHMILLSALVGVLLIPAASSLVKFQTNVPLPKEFAAKAAPESIKQDFSTSDDPSQAKLVVPVSYEVPWSILLGFAWTVGVAFVALRYLAGLVSLRSIRESSAIARDFSLDFDELARNNGVSIDWELRISSNPTLRTAMTWGLRHPVILLPSDSSTWTSHRLEMILLHEFAHLRRKDFASQMLAELACAFYWFNPIVWLSARAMREDAELAADEAVVSAGIRPSDYASELLQIAATLSTRNRMLNRVGISNMTNPKIKSRLKAILSSTEKNRGITLVNVLATLVLSGIAVAGIASLKVQQTPKTDAELQTLALTRLKNVALGTIMYATDYDENFPAASKTKDVQRVVMPYIKDAEVFKSPRAGAEFLYNPKIAGVNMSMISMPAEAIMWFESTPVGIPPAAAYADGHAMIVLPDKMAKFKNSLKKTFPKKGIGPSGGVGQ